MVVLHVCGQLYPPTLMGDNLLDVDSNLARTHYNIYGYQEFLTWYMYVGSEKCSLLRPMENVEWVQGCVIHHSALENLV